MAAKAIGVPTPRILSAYVVPNAIGPIIVSFSATLGEAMVLESSFSFLGDGLNDALNPRQWK